jgi:hypothetical protein
MARLSLSPYHRGMAKRQALQHPYTVTYTKDGEMFWDCPVVLATSETDALFQADNLYFDTHPGHDMFDGLPGVEITAVRLNA